MMAPRSTLAMILCLGLGVPPGAALADDTGDADDAVPQKPAPQSPLPIFLPTNLGSPETRLGGATRGRGERTPRIEALVPEQAGYTLEAQPVLYWYLGEHTDTRIDFRLIGVDPVHPILERTLSPPRAPGVQRVALADLGVELAPGLVYQWFVLVVPDPDDRDSDSMVGGGLERVKPSAELRAKLEAAGPARAQFVLAEAGIWYDALDRVSRQIDADPGNRRLLAQRAALFEQVGLENLD